ncbi:MAG: hypothetical protein ACW98F_02015 [Candidatus Hodarchaeales archaeon]|jgi:hypothetical protein
MEAGKSTSSNLFEQFNVPWMIFTTGVYVILGIILPVLQYFGGFITYSNYLGGSSVNERMDFYWNIMDYSTQGSSGSQTLIEYAFDSNIGLIWIILQIWGVIWLASQIVAATLLILPIIDKITIERSRKIELTKLGFKIGLVGTGIEYLLYFIVLIFQEWELDFGVYQLPETPQFNLFLVIGLGLAWLMYYLGYSSITDEFPDV